MHVQCSGRLLLSRLPSWLLLSTYFAARQPNRQTELMAMCAPPPDPFSTPTPCTPHAPSRFGKGDAVSEWEVQSLSANIVHVDSEAFFKASSTLMCSEQGCSAGQRYLTAVVSRAGVRAAFPTLLSAASSSVHLLWELW